MGSDMNDSVPKKPLLIAQRVCKSFFKGAKEIAVVKGIDLTVHQGDRVAITGASGVGKSTLLHMFDR